MQTKKPHPNEKTKRNEALYAYHLKHPKTGSTKLGRIFSHRNKEGKQVPLDPSVVWRIIKRMKDKTNEWCPQHGYPVPCYKCGYNGAEKCQN